MNETLKQAMKTNLDPIILSISNVDKFPGRKCIKAKKQKGKKIHTVIHYENGLYSDSVCW